MDGLDPNAITLSPGSEPFTLTPVIEDMVRTRFCVPGSIFVVEGIDAVPVTETGRWQAIRILLGDGELCIQALLDGALHRFVQTGEVSVGCYVRLQNFELRWRKVLDGTNEESMAFLVLRDLVTIGSNAAVAALHSPEPSRDSASPDETEPIIETGNLQQASAPTLGPETPTKPRPPELTQADTEDADLEDAFDSFEALTFPVKKKTPKTPRSSRPPPSSQAAAPKSVLPVALPRDWHDPQTPLKLTTLRSIPHLPYAQNWTCNVLVIIASLSPVEPSHLPPYRQRTARLADPSTTKQVHLTVFLDPDGFSPKVGSAVLLTGVKNHRFDGGSLKKYASDGKAGAQWWFEDPWDMTWCDVAGIKQWWADLEAAMAELDACPSDI